MCLVVFVFVGAAVAHLGAADAIVMLHDEQGLLKILVISAAFVTCMYYFDLYDSSIVSSPRGIPTRLIEVMGTVCVLLALLYYVYPSLALRREIFLIGASLVGLVLILWRRLFVAINSHSELADRVLLFGDGPLSDPLVREIETRPELGMRIVSQFVLPPDELQHECGTLSQGADDLLGVVRTHRVNRILVASGDRRGKLPVETLLVLKSQGVRIEDAADVYEEMTGKVPIESLRLGWLLFSPGFCVSRFLRSYKRMVSILISILGLLLTLALVPFVMLAIKLTSEGPVFYKQKRVGLNGKVFECYKFRTMRADAEADSGPTWADDDDPRITHVGRFLRISRLDEIPQLWNVLRGDMSLVGPRPERPEFADWLRREIPHYQLRQCIRPGITGWAQIRFKYTSSVEDAKEKLRYDLFYVKNMSPGLDVLVFLQTIKVILLGRGAQ